MPLAAPGHQREPVVVPGHALAAQEPKNDVSVGVLARAAGVGRGRGRAHAAAAHVDHVEGLQEDGGRQGVLAGDGDGIGACDGGMQSLYYRH